MMLISALLLLIQGVFADDQFQPLREDFNVPSHCADMKATLFTNQTEIFTFGRKDAVSMGFTFEYPVQRNNASILWDYFKSHIKGKPNLNLYRKIKENPELHRDYKVIVANYEELGVDFGNEGDVLEVLATTGLRELFPAPMYFITGAVEYRQSAADRTIGEIDILVASGDSCDVLYVGEVKLGSGRALRKAYQQLQRFSDFLNRENGSPLGSELDPDGLNTDPVPVPVPVPVPAAI